MKLFELQTDVTSFTYPVTKIAICLSVIILGVFRNRIVNISNAWVNGFITIICFVLAIASILCIYISVGELFYVRANRRETKDEPSEAKIVTTKEIVGIVHRDDIVEIEVWANNKVIKIGSSAESKYASSVFENKLFYISRLEYETIEQFEEALKDLFPEGIVPVFRIDGLPLQ